ncbi:hypothetical protein NHF45_09660 [Maricaulaceae bacterium NA33B04]|nr:hypothetical protein [Maricaulaceae bacterium NA33B04]
MTSNNRIGFSYDRSDQPVSMWGIASGSYAGACPRAGDSSTRVTPKTGEWNT